MVYSSTATIFPVAESTPVQVRMSETLLRVVEKYRRQHLRTSRSDAIKFLIQDYGNKLAQIEKLESRVRELEAEIERLKRGML